MHGVTHNTS